MDIQEAREQVESIVRAVEERGARAAPIQEATDLALACPEAVADLARATIERFAPGGTFHDAALSYLPDGDWDKLVRFALDVLEGAGGNEAACSLIAYASLQALPSLHPHLDRLFRQRPNAGAYYEDYPWRESGDAHFEFLRTMFEDRGHPPERRLKAWRAVLQIRRPDLIAYALGQLDLPGSPSPGLSLDETAQAYLHLVGLNRSHGGLTRLCPDKMFHLTFPKPYFDVQSRPPWLARIHPTWTLEPEPDLTAMRFGGYAEGNCSLCGGGLHRLLDLGHVPNDLGVTERSRLELVTCLSCLGWEHQPLFYRHDGAGRPKNVGYEGPRVQPQFPVGPLVETGVQLAATPRRWRWQDWGLSNSRENLNRLGGEPCWIQDAQYPACPDCGEPMGHLLQLDSDLPTADGGEWLWGSGGIGYVSWCDRCKVSGVLWQCT